MIQARVMLSAVGIFGESFPFGEVVGDIELNIPFDGNFFDFLSIPFTFYGNREFLFYVSFSRSPA